jgi:hypothetical protein
METTRIKLTGLWTVVMFCIVMADIIGFMHAGTLQRMMDGNVGFTITPVLLLLFSVLTAVPIVMIVLSLILPFRANQLLNTVAVGLTSLFVIGAGSTTLSYVFFAMLELLSMIGVLIICLATAGPTSKH